MPVTMDPPMTTRDVAVTAAEVLPGAGAPTAVQALPPAMAQTCRSRGPVQGNAAPEISPTPQQYGDIEYEGHRSKL
jgi:hypothetical protein